MGRINNIDTIDDIKIMILKINGVIETFANPETVSISAHMSDDLVDFTAYNCEVISNCDYDNQLYIAYEKLHTVHTLLRTLSFMLDQYSLPDDKNHVVPFESTQDMAKYFKLMADMCLKESEM